MAQLDCYAGTFLADSTKTATQTIAVTGLVNNLGNSFTPKAIIFWWTGRSDATDAIGRANTRHGFGFASGTSARGCAFGINIDNGANSASACMVRNDACVGTCTSAAGALDGALDLQSLDSGGFTLVVDDQLPASFRVSYLALGGDSITNVANGNTVSVGTGDLDITSPGFQGDMVFMAACGDLPTINTGMTDCSVNFGMSSGSGESGAVGWAIDGGQATMDTQGWASDANALVVMDDDTSGTPVDNFATFSSFLSNGFRLNFNRHDSACQIVWMVIKGGTWLVGNSLTRTDGNDIAVSGLGVAPSGTLVISAFKAEDGASSSAHAAGSIGAASGTSTRVAQALLDENATANAEVTPAIEYDAVYINISTASAVQGLMDVKSFDSDGVTFVMDDTDPSQCWFGYLVCGPAAVATTALGWNMAETHFRIRRELKPVAYH